MAVSGKVGDTFTLKDNPPFSKLYVVLTVPNENGKVIIVPFTKALYGIQTFVVFSEKNHCELFKGNVTVRYTDARFVDHQKLIQYQKDNPEKCKDNCPLDIIFEIIKGAFKAQQSKNSILVELEKQYPNLINNNH